MRSLRGRSGACALLIGGLSLVGGASMPGLAATRAAAAATAPGPASAVGWNVPSVRFEPLTPGSILGVDAIGDYRGAIELARSGAGVSVVDDVALEDYVKGIAEVPSTWPAEALKAQAIAARTYALHDLAVDVATGAGTPTICATDACQVYAGLTKERSAGAAAWTAAVNATAGQVLLYGGGPILAQYSSSNGGRSSSGSQPYLRAVDDPDDAQSPLSHWRVVMPAAQVGSVFGLPGPVTSAGRTASDTIVLGWQASDGSSGSSTVPTGEFHRKVEATFPPPAGLPETLPSYRFEISADGGSVIVDGHGWGHGIGMSQYGAFGKALRGMGAADILSTYYGGIRPVVSPTSQLPRSIHVVLDAGRATASVVGSAQFRVLAGDGRVLAVAGAGRWSVVPAAGGVRVVPPADQQGAPGLQVLGSDPPAAGRPTALRVALSVPAVVSATVQDDPSQPPVTVPAQLAQAGQVALSVPALVTPGHHVVNVTADAGGGRLSSTPVALDLPGADVAPRAAVRAEPTQAIVAAVAPATPAGPSPPRPALRRASVAGDDPVGTASGLALAAMVATSGAVGVVWRRRSRSATLDHSTARSTS